MWRWGRGWEEGREGGREREGGYKGNQAMAACRIFRRASAIIRSGSM